MHILLVGGGAREHALAWKIAKSPLVKRLTLVPGSDAMAALGDREDLALEEIPGFAQDEKVSLVVVGPEAPLAAGLADRLEAAGIPCFGPSAAGARLETSKAFTREICAAYGIPAPAYGRFTDAGEAKAFLDTMSAPYVIKADGIAAGKGVTIAQDRKEADAAVDAMLAGAFGAASETIVIEEFLEGPEISVFALTDGETLLPCGDAQDHKRAFDGDQGPNTGGMGGFSPSPLYAADVEKAVMEEILKPTLKALKEKGISYRGVLYAGLVLTADGPKLIEYNCRFGDPEIQMILRRMRSDIVHPLWAAATGRLGGVAMDWIDTCAANVVMATKGYPGEYGKGSAIGGLDALAAMEDVEVFHAGTAIQDGRVTAQGGRVLSITATGDSLKTALDLAYAATAKVDWPEGYYRSDIGQAHR